jgi:hypothetical protein
VSPEKCPHPAIVSRIPEAARVMFPDRGCLVFHRFHPDRELMME